MRRITRIVLFCFLLKPIGILSAQTEKATITNLLTLLPGTWQNSAFNHVEAWNREGFILKGFGLAMNNRDTIFYEKLEINCDVTPPIYTSWVANQNKGVGIQFKLTSATDTSWIFENPNHDFPQKICYVKLNNGTMEAHVSGLEKGNAREEKFSFIKKID